MDVLTQEQINILAKSKESDTYADTQARMVIASLMFQNHSVNYDLDEAEDILEAGLQILRYAREKAEIEAAESIAREAERVRTEHGMPSLRR